MPRSNRVCVFDEETTRVYDLRHEKWNSIISNGSGGLGKVVHVEFGANEDEVLVWSDFSASLKIWSLKTGRAVEIRDPKFTGKDNRGWCYRPRRKSNQEEETGQMPSLLALLCRYSGTDILLLLTCQTYEVFSRVELPTNDAAGIKWSRDGRWLAIWDAASAGYRLCIYTVDGHLYRTITRESSDEVNEWGVEGLGIKSVEWVPGNELISVGGWDGRVRMLSTRTFSSFVFLDHTPIINAPSVPVYTELVDGQGNRSYETTQQPITPPKAPVEKNDTGIMKHGISILAFNANGTLCATRDDSTPSTLWIWDLKNLKPIIILIQYAPIRSVQWHPDDSTRLLLQTHQDLPTVYLCTVDSLSGAMILSNSTNPPEILTFQANISKPANFVPARWTVTWLNTALDKKSSFLFGHQQTYIIVWPDGKDQILRFEREDEEQSDDSLYEILTGRTPRFQNADFAARESGAGSVGGLDDTFREKRKARGDGGEKSQRAFEESGMDEMF